MLTTAYLFAAITGLLYWLVEDARITEGVGR
jgi:hypothetical protein